MDQAFIANSSGADVISEISDDTLRSERDQPADELFRAWLSRLDGALSATAADAFAQLFTPDGYWRDILSFTWERRTFQGRDAVRHAFASTAESVEARRVRVAEDRTAPRFTRRGGREVLEGWFAFDTRFGSGAGFARLNAEASPGQPLDAQLLLTSLFELRGFEEKTGNRRPSGEHYSKIQGSNSWKQDRDYEQAFENREPQVIVIGAGHSGLMLAARLRQIGVDALVLEKQPHVGDGWRNRYNNLTLHNKLSANHFPYLPFPTTWPEWLPKDMLGDWLEFYARVLELNVWTGVEVAGARFDEVANDWVVDVRRSGLGERTLRCKHLVMATGVSGGVPKRGNLPGLEDFQGSVVHSSEFKSGADWVGRDAIVVGTGNSGHDIAQDLYVSGARSVSILQRGPTCVLSLEPSAIISYSIYDNDVPVEDTDLMVASLPYPMLIETYQWITKRTCELDRELLRQLNEVGFKTHTGHDATGFQLLYLRGAGGYYIDVGCAQLLIDKKVGLIQAENVERVTAQGLQLIDGSVTPCNLLVLATGFESMHESVGRLLGKEVAQRVGPVWGFDEEGNLRGMWTRLRQPGLWLMGGSILEARLNSRFLALQIQASLLGLLPAHEDLPLPDMANADNVPVPA